MKKLREPLIKPRNRKNLAPVHAYNCEGEPNSCSESEDAGEGAVDYWIDNSDCYAVVGASGAIAAITTANPVVVGLSMFVAYMTYDGC